MRGRIEVTENISKALEDIFTGVRIDSLSVCDIKVDDDYVYITIDSELSNGWILTTNLQVGLGDDTKLSKLLREGVEKKQAEKHWFKLEPHWTQERNVAELNRYLFRYGVHIEQKYVECPNMADEMQICIEKLPTEEEE